MGLTPVQRQHVRSVSCKRVFKLLRDAFSSHQTVDLLPQDFLSAHGRWNPFWSKFAGFPAPIGAMHRVSVLAATLLLVGVQGAYITVEAGGSIVLEGGGDSGQSGSLSTSARLDAVEAENAALREAVTALQQQMSAVALSVDLPSPPAPPQSPMAGNMQLSEMQTFPHAGTGICSTNYGGCMQAGVNAGNLHSSWNRDVTTMLADNANAGANMFSGHSYASRPNYLGFDVSAAHPNGIILDGVGIHAHYNVVFDFEVQASNTPGAWAMDSEAFPADEVWVTLSASSFNAKPSAANGVAGNVDLTADGFVKTTFENTTPYLKYRLKITTGAWAAFGWAWSGGIVGGPTNPFAA